MFGLRAMFVLLGLAVVLTAASPMNKFNKHGFLQPENKLEETDDSFDLEITTVPDTTTDTDTTTDATETDDPNSSSTSTTTTTTTSTTTQTPTTTTTSGSSDPNSSSTSTTTTTTTPTSGSSAVYCSLVLVISSFFLL